MATFRSAARCAAERQIRDCERAPRSCFLKGGQATFLRPETERLTTREREIEQLLAEGKSNKQTAHLLDLSVKTVGTPWTAAMRKRELKSLPDLVRYAVRMQIMRP
ncbi:response regulator transcription factor [Microvirga makkahensis]|uniref:response regulator transcription factor n=1 Tax=Microvirga makkahensis TaxID=1128670 RepID=UPI003CCDEED3